MSKKIIKVEGSAERNVLEKGIGTFYSTHKPEDVDRWLNSLIESSDGEMSDYEFDRIFEPEWSEYNVDEDIEEFEFNCREPEPIMSSYINENLGCCEFENEIQEFLDEEQS